MKIRTFTSLGAALIALGACASAGAPETAGDYGEYIPITARAMTGAEYRADNIIVEKNGGRLLISAGSVKIVYDLARGIADICQSGGGEKPVLNGVFAETEIGGQKISSAGLARDGNPVYLEEISDSFGPGVKISVLNTGPELNIWQNYYAYQNRAYVLLETVIESAAGTQTNYIAPIAAGDGADEVLSLGPEAASGSQRFLFVPFDNDAFVRYRSDRLMGASESYEVTAVFDNITRQGMITGSVSHDTWKTGIRAKTGMGRNNTSPITDFRVFGGITSKQTRDTQPHGSVGGHHINSPKIFLGFFADWRDGMDAYGEANGIIAPPLPWDQGPPFGWNSWSAVAEKVNYDIYVDSSDFLKQNVPSFANDQGVVYINFDSFWDNLSEVQRKSAASHARANGHRPGIYHTPFTFWGNVEQSMEWSPGETGGRYKWYDLLLKDSRGRPIPAIGGALALDPTHPGTKLVNEVRINQFRELGFEYVKLDFMSHGAAEGMHFDKRVTTGIQAYNQGMKHLLEVLGDDIPNQQFFISLSIAPVFPASYAHGRRISCDVFGTIDNAEYMLNSLTYGWWLHRSVYPFNDPDHIVVYNSYNHRDPILFNEGLTRYISSAIAGGFMIDSDDFRIPEARDRAKQILNNQAVNRLAASGITFRPVEGDTNDRAADVFVRHDGDASYLAVFNFNRDGKKTMTIDLARAGLDPEKTYRMVNLIDSRETAVSGAVSLELEPAEPRIFKLF
jgi:hypothetical protein